MFNIFGLINNHRLWIIWYYYILPCEFYYRLVIRNEQKRNMYFIIILLSSVIPIYTTIRYYDVMRFVKSNVRDQFIAHVFPRWQTWLFLSRSGGQAGIFNAYTNRLGYSIFFPITMQSTITGKCNSFSKRTHYIYKVIDWYCHYIRYGQYGNCKVQ